MMARAQRVARWGRANARAVRVQGWCVVALCEPCFVSLCLFIAGEELFQSFCEPAAKLHFLPRPCSCCEASQPNGGRARQAACTPAWVSHTHTRPDESGSCTCWSFGGQTDLCRPYSPACGSGLIGLVHFDTPLRLFSALSFRWM